MSGERVVSDPLLSAVRRLGTALDRFDESVAQELGVARSDLLALHLLEVAAALEALLDERRGTVGS